MVHVFSALNKYFALDVESGSVFMPNKLSFLLLKRRNGENVELGGYSKEQIESAEKEINDLIDAGVLFSPLPPNKPIEEFKRAPLKAMCLNICYACNLSCAYCFAKEGVNTAAIMSEQTACRAIDFLVENSGSNKRLEVDFFGGEPLINFDAVKKTTEYARLLEAKVGKTFKLTITTNALALDEQKIEWINSNIQNVVLSIDGRENVHNFARRQANGGESYQTVLKNSLLLSKARDNEHYVRGTYTRKNTDFDKDVAHLHNVGFNQISLEPVVLEQSHKLAITKEQLPAIKRSYERLAKHYLAARKNEQSWYNFFHFMLDFKHSPCERKLISACGAGNEYVAVTPDGKLYPCHQFAGNSDFELGDIYSGFNQNTAPEKIKNANVRTKNACKQCWAKYYCGGGCAANNHTFGGDLNEPYEIGCQIMRVRTEFALAVNAIESANGQK